MYNDKEIISSSYAFAYHGGLNKYEKVSYALTLNLTSMKKNVLAGPLALIVKLGTMDDPQAVKLEDLYPHHYGDQDNDESVAVSMPIAA
jgi:hypothetical protein